MLSDLGWGEDRGPLREKRFSLCHQVSSFQLSYPLQGFLEWETLTNCLWLLAFPSPFQGLTEAAACWEQRSDGPETALSAFRATV